MAHSPIKSPQTAANSFKSTVELDETLRERGCHGCDLGFQSNINGCCIMRGSHSSSMMIIGEGPGKDEDSTRKVFTGPAGRLMDKIFASVGLDTNDFYCTNAVLCRPVATWKAMKQNLTPKVDQLSRCKPYLERQVQLLNPRLIVTVGRVAAKAVIGRVASMGAIRGRLFDDTPHWQVPGGHKILVFPMLHPAYLLHSQKDQQKYQEARENMWDDIRHLSKIITQENLNG